MRSSSLLSVICVAMFLVGCGTPYLTISVQSDPKTNDKRPFYMLLRMIDDRDFVKESYKEVADKMRDDPDNTVIKA